MIAFRPVDPIEDVLFRLSEYRRRALGVRSDFEADLMEWLGFVRRQARIVAELYAAGGPVRREVLLVRAGVKARTLEQDLSRIREALGDGALPRPTEGAYQLTQAGRAACDEAVERVGLGYLRGRLAA